MSDESIDQNIDGDHNIQAGRDVNILHGVDPKDHAEVLAENKILKEKLAMLESTDSKNPSPEEKQAADDALKSAEKMNQLGASIDPMNEFLLGRAAIVTGHLREAEIYLNRALLEFEKTEHHHNTGGVLNELGYLAHVRGELDQAKTFYNRSLKFAEEHSTTTAQAAILGNLSQVAQTQMLYPDATDFLKRALELTEGTTDQETRANVYSQLANIAYQQLNWDEAESYWRKSKSIYDEIPSPTFGDLQGLAICLLGLSYVAIDRGNVEEWMELSEKSLSIGRDINDIFHVSTVCSNMANVMVQFEPMRKDAEQLSRMGLEYAEMIGDVERIMQARFSLANILSIQPDKDNELQELLQQIFQDLEKLGIDPMEYMNNAMAQTVHRHGGPLYE